MSKVFLKRGDFYSQTEGNFSVMENLDDGIYQIHQNPLNLELFLEKISDAFNFGFKLYGLDENLVSHVVNTYNRQEVKRNLGILLNGAKGTGKTVTAKYIANKLGLPVIICDKPYQGLPLFLASIGQDCVFFFDEFEKNFRLECGDDENCAGEDLLSIMDGVYNTEHCHVFILTTNELKVNDNLISRPSRIRYLKSFGDVIDRKILEEYVDDNLERKEYRDEIMDFIDGLTIATIDIVKSIVEEVNLHNTHIEEFKNFFNVKEATYKYYTRYWIMDAGCKNTIITKEQFLKKAKSYKYGDDDDDRPQFGSVTLKKNIKKMKVGDYWGGYRWRIENIDLENGFVELLDMEYRQRKEYVYIENMDAKPSLYDNGGAYTDPYYDYWD